MKLFRKILVRGTALAVTLLYSGSVFAQNYVMKTAFVGEQGFKKSIIEKLFDENHRVFEDAANVCGFRLTTPQDSVLYKFREEALNKDQLRAAKLPDCNVIFMIVDFSSPKTNLKTTLTKDVEEVFRASQRKSKVIVIAMNTEGLSKDELKRFGAARNAYGKDNFDYVLTSFDEDDETFRNKFFEVTDRVIDWRRLPTLVESSERIIHRLIWLQALVSKEFDKDALIRELIRQDNARIDVELRTTDVEQRAAHTEERTTDLEQKMATTQSGMAAMKKDIADLKVAVGELNRFKDEQKKSDKLSQALKDLSDLLRKMSTEDTFNSEELQQVLQKVDAGISHLDTAADGTTGEDDLHSEFKKLRRHLNELKLMVNDERNVISGQQEVISGLQSRIDKLGDLNEIFIASKEEFAKKAEDIANLVSRIDNIEKDLKSISETTTKDFIWAQYEKSNWYWQWRLRRAFPYVKERAEREEELAKKSKT